MRVFSEFKTNLSKWVESIRRDSSLDTMINRQELEKTANKIVESKAIDDENADLVISLIDEQTEKLEKDNFEVSKPEVRRRRKKTKSELISNAVNEKPAALPHVVGISKMAF